MMMMVMMIVKNKKREEKRKGKGLESTDRIEETRGEALDDDELVAGEGEETLFELVVDGELTGVGMALKETDEHLDQIDTDDGVVAVERESLEDDGGDAQSLVGTEGRGDRGEAKQTQERLDKTDEHHVGRLTQKMGDSLEIGLLANDHLFDSSAFIIEPRDESVEGTGRPVPVAELFEVSLDGAMLPEVLADSGDVAKVHEDLEGQLLQRVVGHDRVDQVRDHSSSRGLFLSALVDSRQIVQQLQQRVSWFLCFFFFPHRSNQLIVSSFSL